MKLLICDLDGVIANNEARFVKAEEAKQQWQDSHRVPGTSAILKEYGAPGANDIFWQEAFNPELVALDTLIAGVVDALLQLEHLAYTIYLLTSRPESMRDATGHWLVRHEVAYSRDIQGHLIARTLIMKAPTFQYVKTVTWKAGMVQTLHRMYGADELCFVDDEPANQKAVLDAYPDGGDFGIVHVYGSLAEAVKEVV